MHGLYNRSMDEAHILTATGQRLAASLTRPLPPLVRFDVDGHAAGWLDRARCDRLAQFPRIFVVNAAGVRFAAAIDTPEARTDAMAEVADALAAAAQLSAWRNERYAVRPSFDAPPWFYLERACARWFGIRTWAVHVNGACSVDAEHYLWFARRSLHKSIDPGSFDTLVGGGIAETETVAQALYREAWEEAGIPAALAHEARGAGHVDVTRHADDGLQRETIWVCDLALPADFVPDNQDGEAIEHRRLSLADAAALTAATAGDVTTLDAALVTLDYLLRRGRWPLDADTREALTVLCRRPPR